MRRMIFQLDEGLRQRLRRRARERGVSEAQVIRDALGQELAAENPPRPLSIGSFDSGHGDLAERVEELYEPPAWRSS
jgi:plasmid stability protein